MNADNFFPDISLTTDALVPAPARKPRPVPWKASTRPYRYRPRLVVFGSSGERFPGRHSSSASATWTLGTGAPTWRRASVRLRAFMGRRPVESHGNRHAGHLRASRSRDRQRSRPGLPRLLSKVDASGLFGYFARLRSRLATSPRFWEVRWPSTCSSTFPCSGPSSLPRSTSCCS